MAWLFALTLFLSAALLFLVQPLLARMTLPLLGGTPAVWNTCMVFFQALLLAGYTYAHALPTWIGLRRHVFLHLGVLGLPLFALPLALAAERPPPPEATPVYWLLGQLTVSAGLPFFAVATTAPLLQRWFAATGHPSAHDPYYLYAASNLGSMLALLSYPLLIEPTFTLHEQSRLWSGGYGLLVLLIGCCALAVYPALPAPSARPVSSSPPAAPSGGTIPRWVLLAFVPSSLMLSVTTYLTTDLAAIPLLWVLPLALYLLSFILVFARRALLPHPGVVRWLPLVVLVVVLALLSEATQPVLVLVGIHLLGLFWIALACHGELARTRPPAGQLTAFYLWMSAGGVLGGLFNALLAPLLFRGVAEYPLVLILACLLQTSPRRPRPVRLDYVLPGALALLTLGLVLGVQLFGLEPGQPSTAAAFTLPAILCYTFHERPLRFGLGIAALLLAGSCYQGMHGRTEYALRSFFGVHRVTLDPTGSFRQLVHGNTVHGRQSLDPKLGHEALTYYHRTGPIGRLFQSLEGDRRLQRVGLVGLGAGSLASYAKPGQHWTYYEIDPAVVYLARDSGLFTFCRDCEGTLDYVLGDARLTLARTEERFGVLVLDAFSSDSIPIHLLTRQALQLYRARLGDEGILAFHVSNRYLNLQPVLAGLARQSRPPLACLICEDLALTNEAKAIGKSPSIWVVLANERSHLDKAVTAGFGDLHPGKQVRVWDDDFSNLLEVFKWRLEGREP